MHVDILETRAVNVIPSYLPNKFIPYRPRPGTRPPAKLAAPPRQCAFTASAVPIKALSNRVSWNVPRTHGVHAHLRRPEHPRHDALGLAERERRPGPRAPRTFTRGSTVGPHCAQRGPCAAREGGGSAIGNERNEASPASLSPLGRSRENRRPPAGDQVPACARTGDEAEGDAPLARSGSTMTPRAPPSVSVSVAW